MYETEDDYTRMEIEAFKQWFMMTIGTDYDLNESASGLPNQFYLVLVDLTDCEIEMVRNNELYIRTMWDK